MGIGLHPAERFEEFGAAIARRHQWATEFSPTDDDRAFIRRKACAFGFDESYHAELWRCVERGYMAACGSIMTLRHKVMDLRHKLAVAEQVLVAEDD